MKKKALVVFVNLILFVVLGEIVSRTFPKLFDPPPPYNTAELDDEFGWKQKPGYIFEGEQMSLDNKTYDVNIEFAPNGFRKFDTQKKDSIPRILIIGDSFTQAIEVSNGKVFYDYLEENNLFEVYAYGMAGYGTLQEYLILEKYLEPINPSIVLLQFCSNDFIDNELELEKQSIYRVGQRRPYFAPPDSIFYANPLGIIERTLIKSKFLKFLNDKHLRLKAKLGIKKKNSSEEQIAKEGNDCIPYKNSQETTGLLLQKMNARIGNETKLVVMNADGFEPQAKDLENICKLHSIPLIQFPKEAMEKARVIQETYTRDGFHWNEIGHQLIGENLKKELQQIEN